MHQVARQRFNIMTEINKELIKCAIGTSSFHPPIAQGQQPNPDPEAYRSVLQRLQCNLLYMASSAERLGKTPALNIDMALSAPSILTPPDCAPFLGQLYQRLKQMFPDQKPMAQVQGQQGMGPGQPQVRQQPRVRARVPSSSRCPSIHLR